MIKKFTLALILTLVMAHTSTINAVVQIQNQDQARIQVSTSPSHSPVQTRQNNQSQEQKAQTSGQAQQAQKRIANKFAQRLQTRYQATNNRFLSIMNKMEARLQKIQNQGEDVASSLMQLEQAKQTLTNIEKLTTQNVQDFTEYSQNEQAADSLAQTAVSNARDIRQQYIKLKQQLIDIINNL